MPVGPANNVFAAVLSGFEALNLRPSAEKAHASRMGRGTAAGKNPDFSFPSLIPVHTPSRTMPPPPKRVRKSPKKPRTPLTPFINKFTNERIPAFDDTRVATLEAQFAAWKDQMEKDIDKHTRVHESVELYKQKSRYSKDEEQLLSARNPS